MVRQVFAGIVADRISRKKLVVGSLFVWSLVTYLLGVPLGTFLSHTISWRVPFSCRWCWASSRSI